MTNTAPMALMAAALFLAMQGQPRAQETVAAECPCSFTAEAIPLWVWQGMVECKSEAGGQTALVENPSERKPPSFVAQLFIRGFCIRYDEDKVVWTQRLQVMSDDQVKACSQKIIDYAQELAQYQTEPPVIVLLDKCRLK